MLVEFDKREPIFWDSASEGRRGFWSYRNTPNLSRKVPLILGLDFKIKIFGTITIIFNEQLCTILLLKFILKKIRESRAA